MRPNDRTVSAARALLSRHLAVLREALATARAQPIASVVAIIMVAGMCATVLLTTGRTVGAEQAVMASIDSAGTRTIVVRADTDAGLNSTVLQRLTNIDGVEWVGAFGPANDATNALISDGQKVPVRLVWSTHLTELGVPELQALPDETGWASALALRQLGMPEGSGGVASPTGASYAIAGEIQVPDYLRFLEPLVVVPQSLNGANPGSVSVLVVIASSPNLVAPVSLAVQSVLGVDDPTKVSLTTSESLAALRAIVEGQLGSFGRDLVIVIFALTAVLVAAILYGLVMLRRKDFGRRRALGASQSLIIALLLTQVASLSFIGALLGSVVAAFGLAATGDPLPQVDFFVAVSVLSISVGLMAAVLPAVAAARRDPLKELRVP